MYLTFPSDYNCRIEVLGIDFAFPTCCIQHCSEQKNAQGRVHIICVLRRAARRYEDNLALLAPPGRAADQLWLWLRLGLRLEWCQ